MSRTLRKILKMQNPIQTYAWGSRSAIADLMGHDAPSSEPQAELWMGAHPKSPSQVWIEGRWEVLSELIERHPIELLGKKVAERYDQTLPYLFKVLAAGEPLSIQAHPDAKQARDGFLKENLKNIDLADPRRNYRDDRPKPECMCALTPFTGLCGFRPPSEVITVSDSLWPAWEKSILNIIKNSNDSNSLRDFFQSLMEMEQGRLTDLVSHVVEAAGSSEDQNEIYAWINRLHRKYPGDVGVLSPLLLNIIRLEPGEALFLPPKQLHAYLDGLGIELMGNSDNVLRGGLTPKHIDVKELLHILDFHPYKPQILVPQAKSDTEGIYASSSDTFSLSKITVTSQLPHRPSARRQGPEIMLVVDGTAAIRQSGDDEDVIVDRGESVFIPATVTSYTATGNATLFKAAANL